MHIACPAAGNTLDHHTRETLVTVVAALPHVALHLEVAVLGAEVHIGSQHHLRIAFLHGAELQSARRTTEVRGLGLQQKKGLAPSPCSGFTPFPRRRNPNESALLFFFHYLFRCSFFPTVSFLFYCAFSFATWAFSFLLCLFPFLPLHSSETIFNPYLMTCKVCYKIQLAGIT
jgi:hypothetical protein